MPKSTTATFVGSSELTRSTAIVITETVRLLVRYPDQVTLETRTNPASITLLLRVAPDDLGVVIGRRGRTARSLRVLLNAISPRNAVPFELDISAEHA